MMMISCLHRSPLRVCRLSFALIAPNEARGHDSIETAELIAQPASERVAVTAEQIKAAAN